VSFTACSMSIGIGLTCADPAPVFRSYASFSEAADENAVSRIYIGIHFRRAVEKASDTDGRSPRTRFTGS
jgi:hypothetical protein